MAEAPKIPHILRERLRLQQAGVRPGEHPDADLLAGYSENSLSSRERSLVLSHLGMCPDCREVVMLSQPEVPEASVPAGVPAARVPGWMVLRWAALAACLVLTVGVVLLNRSFREAPISGPAGARLESPTPPEQIAKQSADEDQRESKNSEAAMTAKLEPQAENRSVMKKTPREKRFGKSSSPEGVYDGLTGKSAIVGNHRFDYFSAAAKSRVASAGTAGGPVARGVGGSAPLAPSVPPTVIAGNGNSTIGRSQGSALEGEKSDGQRGQLADRLVAQASAPAANAAAESATAGAGDAKGELDRAWLRNQEPGKKKTAAEAVPAGAAPAASAPVTGSTLARARENPSAAAESYRASTANFETKDQAETLTLNKEKLATATPAAPMQWRIRGGKLQQSSDAGKTWQEINVAPGISLHAFWSLGSNVWAGGTGGSLFHITDAGKNQVRIPIKLGEGDVSQTVVAVTFSDELHGIIMLENGQILQTTDGGKSWERH